jgi:hypothetical protein
MNANVPARGGVRQAAQAVERGLMKSVGLLSRGIVALGTFSPLILVVALVLVAVWWHEHNVRIRQGVQLTQLKKQTQADVARLEAQSKQAVREANQEHARQIEIIEDQNRQLERNGQVLQRRLEDLVGRTRTQVDEVATLSTAEVAHRVATRLGLDQQDFGLAAPNPAAGAAKQALSQTDASGRASSGTSESAEAHARTPQSESATPPSLKFDQNALRKVEVALVELDSCKQQSGLQGGLISNCHEQVAAKNQIIDEQRASLAKLNEALGAKDQILERRNEEHKAELKAIRGTWAGRLARTVEMVGIGVAIGVAIRH